LTFEIRPYRPEDGAAVVALSLRAWAPVFDKLEPAVPAYVYRAFYPDGWAARQAADVQALLENDGDEVLVALEAEQVIGWVGVRLHPEDRMGEIRILAVDPSRQRAGVARALMDRAIGTMRDAGMAIVMVETGDDPGHAPSRATYESAGFERWPVARYFREL
jgi:GNAT superfamily N-acetyltransferase